MRYRKLLAMLAAALLSAPLFAQAANGASAPADTGVLVIAVQPGSPAEKAGLARGDIILEANGKAVSDAADLREAVNGITSGATVQLKVRHGDAQKTLSVVAGTQNGRPWLGILPQPGRAGELAFGGPGMRGPDGNGGGMPGPGMGRYFGVFPGEGALVESVSPGSPAEKAGLKKGDLILSVDGTTVDERNPLSDLVASKKVGDSVTLAVTSWQQQGTHDVKVTLARNPDKDGAWLGLRYIAAPARFAGPGAMDGALVMDVAAGSPAAQAGIQARDLITAIGGARVTGAQQVVSAVTGHKPGDTLSLTVVRRPGGTPTDLTVTLGKSPSDAGKAWLGISLGGPRGFMPRGLGTGPAMEGARAFGPGASFPGAL